MFETSVILFVMAIFIEIISILFFRSDGKGCIFIAGYNLTSEEVKKKYDEKGICRFMGKEFAILGIGFFIGAAMNFFLQKKVLFLYQSFLGYGLYVMAILDIKNLIKCLEIVETVVSWIC